MYTGAFGHKLCLLIQQRSFVVFTPGLPASPRRRQEVPAHAPVTAQALQASLAASPEHSSGRGRRLAAEVRCLPSFGAVAHVQTEAVVITTHYLGRKKQKLAKERAGLSKLPDLKDAEAVQKFFLEEIQLGEELLAQGEYEKGVDHLTNAIAVCGQPQQLLQVLQQTLPPPVFQMLLTKLPTISQRIVSAQCLAEDDVE
ncbi:PREDICTED: mitochondrial import receptor subunit TOM20 homolog [Nipponia nippon]|uniref:mitochondrial import receptor subunit TOM20 homolog n=1 Tax=Nipponia nippon TaxID=128390 RepID=UPI00051105EE|nr:PREDICTED: mitochondrial import receptor subunit TOM20 homolog [Nipponia nippon]